jgi:zinc protease
MIALVFAVLGATLARPALPPQPAWSAPTPARVAVAGTNLVVLPRHDLPLVHVLVTIPAGSAVDPANRPGLAAAVASMLQDGGTLGRTAPEVARVFAELGTELEEHIDFDQVQLQLTVLSRNLDRALDLLCELLTKPRFDPVDWKRAQARRIDEIHRRIDEPERLADDLFNRVLFGEHPYGHPFLGTVESVRAITVDDLRGFWATRYAPQNMTFILVGDADAQAVGARFKTLFGTKPAAPSSWPQPPPMPKPPAARVVLVDRPGAAQSQLRVGHLGAARTTPDFAALSLLETILGGSFTSRLNLNLREKHGYTYGARASFDLHTAPGPFVASAGVRTDATAAALKEMVAEIAGMRAPLSAAELVKGRLLVVNSIVEAFGDGSDTTGYLADLATHRLPLDSWSKLPAALAALDIPSLTRVAARYFHPDELTILVVGDRKAIEPELRLLPFVKSIELLTP